MRKVSEFFKLILRDSKSYHLSFLSSHSRKKGVISLLFSSNFSIQELVKNEKKILSNF